MKIIFSYPAMAGESVLDHEVERLDSIEHMQDHLRANVTTERGHGKLQLGNYVTYRDPRGFEHPAVEVYVEGRPVLFTRFTVLPEDEGTINEPEANPGAARM